MINLVVGVDLLGGLVGADAVTAVVHGGAEGVDTANEKNQHDQGECSIKELMLLKYSKQRVRNLLLVTPAKNLYPYQLEYKRESIQ